MAGTFIGGAAASVGATAAWAKAESGSTRERLAAAGYLPGVLGAASLALSLPTMLVPAARPHARVAAALGAATLLGSVAGTAAARSLGLGAGPRTYPDSALPKVQDAAARAEADATRRAIDRSADDIVIWVPGTMRTRIPAAFAEGVRQAFDGRDVSLVKLPTHPDYRIAQGVADSAEAVRLLVTELDAQRRPGQRILLAGESQGAWAIGVALEDASVRDAVDRAVAWGNPGIQPHQYDGAGDGKVLELTDERDVVGRSINGDPELVLEAMSGLMDGDLGQLWRIPAIAANNPYPSSLLVRSGVRLLTPDGYGRDPHNHREFMGAAARFLADAPRD